MPHARNNIAENPSVTQGRRASQHATLVALAYL
jgi:hypothetical protein